MTVLQISQLPSKFSRARKITWKKKYSQNDIIEILFLIRNPDHLGYIFVTLAVTFKFTFSKRLIRV